MIMEILQTAAGAGAARSLARAGLSDVRTYRIPNRLSLAIAAAYLAILPGLGVADWAAGLAVGGAVLLGGAFLFARGLLGGGDVKLAAAIALWAGPSLLGAFVFVSSVSGAALAIFMLAPTRRLMPPAPAGHVGRGLAQPMPFGLPLAIGGLAVVYLRIVSI
jgi:prepilin peptidase CpaA